MAPADIPDETIGRLSSYVDYLTRLAAAQVSTVSSQALAAAAGVNAAQVRKDFSFLVPYGLGNFGTPGVGYETRRLLEELSGFLNSGRERPVVLVGYGSLGAALARYRGFAERNCRLVAVFDVDPSKVGGSVGGVKVHHLAQLEQVLPASGAEIAILTTPAAQAQEVAERLVAVGIKAILNFAPVALSLPSDVTVRQVDLSREIQLLAFRVRVRRERAAPARRRVNASAASQ